MPSISFTDKSIAKVKVNSNGKRTIYNDKKTPYLCLFVRKTKVYYYNRRVNGELIQILIGNTESITLEQVKQKVNGISIQIAEGNNPKLIQIKNKTRITEQKNQLIKFKEVFKLYCKSTPDKASRKVENFHFRNQLKPFHNLTLYEITRRRIEGIMKDLADKKPTANRTLALLSVIISYAIKELDIPVKNHCSSVKKYKLTPRQRFLTEIELAKYWNTALKWIKSDNFHTVQFGTMFLLLYMTGSRSQSVKALKWEYIDLDKKIIEIPPFLTKNREKLILNLEDNTIKALGILHNHPNKKESEYCFYNSKNIDKAIGDIRKTFCTFLKEADIKQDLTPHDIRRSTGAYMLDTGVGMKTIAKQLGHTSTEITDKTYTPLLKNKQREAVDKLARRASSLAFDILHPEVREDEERQIAELDREMAINEIKAELDKLSNETLNLVYRLINNREGFRGDSQPPDDYQLINVKTD